jgi:transposase-like protein
MRNQITFSLESKRQVIEELLSGESRPAQICCRYNITSSVLYHWKRQYSGSKFNNDPTEEGALKDRIEKLERLVVRQLQARVLTRENVELLVKMINEELQTAASGLRDRLEIIDTELRDVRARLTKLFEALETVKLDLDDLASRIKELKLRQDELSKARVLLEAETAAQGVQQVDEALVKAYAEDLQALLEEAGLTERKAFLRSFVKRIEIAKGQVTVNYTLPFPQTGRSLNR